MNPITNLISKALGNAVADSSVDRLSQLLEITPEEVLAIPHDRRLSYRPFTIRKRHGGRRKIRAPSDRLKKLQRRLVRNYLSHCWIHDEAMAYRPHRSVVDHAGAHIGQAIVLTCDLSGFFENTSADRVRRWFRKEEWAGESLRVLMRLCVFENGLPQGAPTSPVLSNILNAELDTRLHEVSSSCGGRYSRYADDLAFSWSSKQTPRSFCSQVEGCLESYGYEVQTLKGWKMQHAADHPEITGVAIHGHRLKPAKNVIARWKRLLFAWMSNKTESNMRRVTGMESFLKKVRQRRR